MSSHSRSPSPPRRASPGGSRSGSRPVSRSRSRSRTRSRSRSKPSSPGRYRRRSRSGSRSRSRSQRSRSRSIPRPTKVDFLHDLFQVVIDVSLQVYDDCENPESSNCIEVFGLNFTTTKGDLDREFGRFGRPNHQEIQGIHVHQLSS